MYLPSQSRRGMGACNSDTPGVRLYRGMGACVFTADPSDATHGIMTCSDPISSDLPPVGGTNAGPDATVTSSPISANYFQPAVNPQVPAVTGSTFSINPMWAIAAVMLFGLVVVRGGRR